MGSLTRSHTYKLVLTLKQFIDSCFALYPQDAYQREAGGGRADRETCVFLRVFPSQDCSGELDFCCSDRYVG